MARERSIGWSAVVGLVAAAAVTFAFVGTAAYVTAHRIARDDALADALRTAHEIGTTVFVPELSGVLDGDPGATAALDAAVAVQRTNGTLVRATIWRQDGRVLWSDDNTLIGHEFPLSAKVAAVFGQDRDYAAVSALTDPQNQDQRGAFAHLVEAYIPMMLVGGPTLALEMYFSDNRVRQAERQLSDRLVPFALLALLVLALAQLPVSIWLVRRATTAQHDRDRMLDAVLVSSERERRLVARHLHDGLVQDLAGAALLLGSPTGPTAVTEVSRALHRAVGDLRDMLVELHPDEITSDTVAELIAESASRSCPDQVVSVTAKLTRPVPVEVAAFLYRCARECTVNVAKHARATEVRITLDSDADGVRLVVRDDGIGIPDPVPTPEGHLGLTLLRESAVDLGGTLALRAAHPGTVVTLTLPPAPG